MLDRNKCLQQLFYSSSDTSKVIEYLEDALEAAEGDTSSMGSIRGALERVRALHDEIDNLYDEIDNLYKGLEATATEK